MRTLDKKTKIEKLHQRRFESPVKRIDPPPPPPPPAAAVPVAASQNLEESVNQLPSPEPEPNSEPYPESSSPTKQESSISQNLERVRKFQAQRHKILIDKAKNAEKTEPHAVSSSEANGKDDNWEKESTISGVSSGTADTDTKLERLFLKPVPSNQSKHEETENRTTVETPVMATPTKSQQEHQQQNLNVIQNMNVSDSNKDDFDTGPSTPISQQFLQTHLEDPLAQNFLDSHSNNMTTQMPLPHRSHTTAPHKTEPPPSSHGAPPIVTSGSGTISFSGSSSTIAASNYYRPISSPMHHHMDHMQPFSSMGNENRSFHDGYSNKHSVAYSSMSQQRMNLNINTSASYSENSNHILPNPSSSRSDIAPAQPKPLDLMEGIRTSSSSASEMNMNHMNVRIATPPPSHTIHHSPHNSPHAPNPHPHQISGVPSTNSFQTHPHATSFTPSPPHVFSNTQQQYQQPTSFQNEEAWRLKEAELEQQRRLAQEVEMNRIRMEEEHKRQLKEDVDRKRMEQELEFAKLKFEHDQIRVEEERRRIAQEAKMVKLKMEQKEQQRVLEMQQQKIQAEAERLKEEKKALALEAEKMRREQEQQKRNLLKQEKEDKIRQNEEQKQKLSDGKNTLEENETNNSKVDPQFNSMILHTTPYKHNRELNNSKHNNSQNQSKSSPKLKDIVTSTPDANHQDNLITPSNAGKINGKKANHAIVSNETPNNDENSMGDDGSNAGSQVLSEWWQRTYASSQDPEINSVIKQALSTAKSPKKPSKFFNGTKSKYRKGYVNNYPESDDEDIFSGIGDDTESESESESITKAEPKLPPTPTEKNTTNHKNASKHTNNPAKKSNSKLNSAKNSSNLKSSGSPHMKSPSGAKATIVADNTLDKHPRNENKRSEEKGRGRSGSSRRQKEQGRHQNEKALSSLNDDANERDDCEKLENSAQKEDISKSKLNGGSPQLELFPNLNPHSNIADENENFFDNFETSKDLTNQNQNTPSKGHEKSSSQHSYPSFAFPESPHDISIKNTRKDYQNKVSLMDAMSPTETSQISVYTEDLFDSPPSHPSTDRQQEQNEILSPPEKSHKDRSENSSTHDEFDDDSNLKEGAQQEVYTSNPKLDLIEEGGNGDVIIKKKVSIKVDLLKSDDIDNFDRQKNLEEMEQNTSLEVDEDFDSVGDKTEYSEEQTMTEASEMDKSKLANPSLGNKSNDTKNSDAINSFFSQYGCSMLDTLTQTICRDPNRSVTNATYADATQKQTLEKADDGTEGDDDEYSDEKTESDSSESDSDSWSTKSKGSKSDAYGLSQQELKKWEAWEKQDAQNPVIKGDQLGSVHDFDDATSQLSRLTELEVRQRRAQHLERRARAHEKLLLSAYTALSIPQDPNLQEKPERVVSDSPKKAIDLEKSFANFMDSDGNVQMSFNEDAFENDKDPKVDHFVQDLLDSFYKKLRTEGLEVLKLNRDKKWQARTLTISREESHVGGKTYKDFSNERVSRPKGLLWVKKFVKNHEYSVTMIDRQGKGGILFSQLSEAFETIDINVPTLGKKLKHGKFKNGVTVTINGVETGGTSREVVLKCVDLQDAQFLMDGINNAVVKGIFYRWQ